jgi:CRISPR-associated endonuclease Csn1
VLPKESMEYQAFMVLNTINNIKVRNEKISCALKQDIYHELFEKNGKITKKRIVTYLNQRGIAASENEVSGIDTTIGCQLSTYRRFNGVLGNDLSKDSVRHMVEDIVFHGTVYGESKTMLHALITENYGDRLSADQMNRIFGFKYRDWGNLSKEFLELEGCNKETGEVTSLIRALWEDEDNLNLMELLHSDKYTFEESLKDKHQNSLKTLTEFTYEDLDSMYFSAPVKRMIWQTLLIIKEVTDILGCPPKKIFVEMTRTEEEKKGDAGRKDSREKELLELYKSIQGDRSWDDEIRDAGTSGKLRSKKLYLYYKQMGKDMYTGLPIDLAELFDDNKYDIDHIYPRHFVKDDSIHNNLVLVDKRKNSRKSDTYPIDSDIRNNAKMAAYWKMLHEKKFINDEKYRRLTGTRSFTEEQKADFIARQLVETSQATKGVNDLLKEIMPEGTTLVYCKAGNVHDFRRDFGFYKSRTINDFHHAHDAYLNIVVGSVYDTKFTSNPLNFIRKEKQEYHLGNIFKRDVVRNGYIA